ncbi:MAG: hypothetical protein RIS47_1617 [Bacteroidota bacterium]|jgi:cell division protein FtsW (lipid II flippase)
MSSKLQRINELMWLVVGCMLLGFVIFDWTTKGFSKDTITFFSLALVSIFMFLVKFANRKQNKY